MSKTKENSSEMKPFVKWVGGKTQLLDLLISMVPKNFNTYYEPFVGGGALFWKISPKKAVINDINNELMNTYNVIKNNYQKLIDTLEEYREKHLQYKKDFHSQIKARERDLLLMMLARFIYLNKTSFMECIVSILKDNSMFPTTKKTTYRPLHFTTKKILLKLADI